MPKGGFFEKQWDAVGGKHVISGSFRPNGSSAIDNTLNTGAKYSATWVSTGRYRLTFPGTFRRVISLRLLPQLNAAPASVTDFIVVLVTVGAASTVIEFVYREGATLTDIASNANNRLHFGVELEAMR